LGGGREREDAGRGKNARVKEWKSGKVKKWKSARKKKERFIAQKAGDGSRRVRW